MKVGEQCLYLAQMKGLSKAEAKNNLNTGLIDWNSRLVEQKNPGTFKRNGSKNSVCRLCFAQA
jgi:ABC-type uncharacterized transport system ATPase subunit